MAVRDKAIFNVSMITTTNKPTPEYLQREKKVYKMFNIKCLTQILFVKKNTFFDTFQQYLILFEIFFSSIFHTFVCTFALK